jgi:PAS domain S-box-containing protein
MSGMSDNGEHELRRFFSLSLDMLCIAGHDGWFKELNPAWEATLGWSRDELLARPYLDFVHKEDRSRTLQEARLLERGGITVAFENRYRCRDGSYRNLLWSAVADPAGGRVFAVARDITALRASEDALRRARASSEGASRSRGRFLAALGWELRAPLERLLEAADLLAGDVTIPVERRQELLEGARLDARAALDTVRGLLELAGLESGQVEARVEHVDLARLVVAATTQVEAQAAGEGCAIGTELPERLAPLRTDERRLEQALGRLLAIATRAAPRGEVVVRVLAEAETRRPERIVVEERAAGAPHEPRAGDSGASRPDSILLTAPGTGGGLELAIARALLEVLGHRLQVLSRGGAGSTYTVDLADAA